MNICLSCNKEIPEYFEESECAPMMCSFMILLHGKIKLQSILKWFSSILPQIVSFSVSTLVLNQARNELVFADIHI